MYYFRQPLKPSESFKPKFVTLNHQHLRRLRKPLESSSGQTKVESDTAERSGENTSDVTMENPPDLISDISKKCDVIKSVPMKNHPNIDLLIKKKFDHVFTTKKGDVLIEFLIFSNFFRYIVVENSITFLNKK